MAGAIRTRERCKCGGKYTVQIIRQMPGMFCSRGCGTAPRYYYIDARSIRRKVPPGTPRPKAVGIVTEDENGHRLDSYFGAARLLDAIRHDYDKNPFAFNAERWRGNNRSRKLKDVWADWKAIVDQTKGYGYRKQVDQIGRLRILPFLGEKIVGRGDMMEITAGDLERVNIALINDQHLAPETRFQAFQRLKECLKFARREKWIGTDDIPEFPKIRRVRIKDIYTASRRVQDDVRAYLPEHFRLAHDFLVDTGCRINEAMGLKKDDLVEGLSRVHIQRGIDPERKEGPPKNGESRMVDISPALFASLKALPALHDAYLWPYKPGLAFNTSDYRKAFTAAKLAAGYPQLTPYGTYRHSVASTVAEESLRESRVAAAKQLGNGVGIVERYIHGEESQVVGIGKGD